MNESQQERERNLGAEWKLLRMACESKEAETPEPGYKQHSLQQSSMYALTTQQEFHKEKPNGQDL